MSQPPKKGNHRSFTIQSVVLLLCFVSGLPAQEPILDHKYTEPFCEYGRSAIDITLSELTKDPAMKGIVVLHPSVGDPVGPYKQRVAIQNLLKFRRFDEKRIEILLGEPELKPSTELWRVPINKAHDLKSRPWDLSVSDLNEPLLVHRKIWIDAIGCGLFEFDHEFFANLLRRNEDVIGRIVIRAATTARLELVKRRISTELNSKHKVGQKRIEFAFVKDKNDDVEYWLLPPGYLEAF